MSWCSDQRSSMVISMGKKGCVMRSCEVGSVVSQWSSMSGNQGSCVVCSYKRSMVSKGSSMNQWGMVSMSGDQRSMSDGNDWMFIDRNQWCESRLVDQSGCRILGLYSRFVGLDVGSVSECVSNVVDNSESSVSISESVRSNFVSMGVSSLSSEGSSSSMVLIVSEGIVSNVLENHWKIKNIIRTIKLILTSWLLN